LVKAFAVPFELASEARVSVRQLLVVEVAPLINELSLLRGFLFAACFLFRSLLLSCHIVLLLLLFKL
jgi:hypothetical protein